jgi:hypothetical protein
MEAAGGSPTPAPEEDGSRGGMRKQGGIAG